MIRPSLQAYLPLILLLVIGCEKPSLNPSMQYEKVYIHQVTNQDETLPIISAWYTGDASRWKIINTYNGHVSPYRLKKGSVIRIPEALMQRFDPIDQQFIDQNKKVASNNKRKRSKNVAAPGKSLEPDTEEPVLPPHVESPDDKDDGVEHDLLIQNLLAPTPLNE